jgi:ABC-type transport system substrate-binding protein
LSARTSFNFDTFDAALSGEPSIVEVLGRTHRRLIEWHSFEDGELGPGFAVRWEHASPTTLLLTIADDSWPAGAGLEGRPVSADDAAQHIDRLLELARGDRMPLSQQPWTYLSVDRVEATDDRTVRVDTNAPDALLVQSLASRFASVQRPEVLDRFGGVLHERHPEHLLGTGDFVYEGFSEGALQFASRDDGAALVDGISVRAAGFPAQSFIDGDSDEFLARDRRDAPAIRDALGTAVTEQRVFEDSPIVSSFSVAAPPWNDPVLVRAISGALNRHWLSAALTGGRAMPAGVVPPASAAPFLPAERDLASVAGYGDAAELEAADARAAWDAAGGPSLGELQLDVPAVFDPLYSAAATVSARLEAVLGVAVRPSVVSYPDIAQRIADGYYGNGRSALWFGWGAPLQSPDPSRWLQETFHSASNTAVAAGFADTRVDLLLDRLSGELLQADRAATIGEVSTLLADGQGGYLAFLLQTAEQFMRKPVRARTNSPFWSQHRDAGVFRQATR